MDMRYPSTSSWVASSSSPKGQLGSSPSYQGGRFGTAHAEFPPGMGHPPSPPTRKALASPLAILVGQEVAGQSCPPADPVRIDVAGGFEEQLRVLKPSTDDRQIEV